MIRNTRKAILPTILTSAKIAPLTFASHRFYATNVKYITSKKAPKAVGPYSQAVKANGTIYVSGCLGIVPETGDLVDNTTVGQARQALINLKNVVEEAGGSLSTVVKTTILLQDINDFKDVNEVYAEFFSGDNKPARMTYAVTAMPKGGRVEIECIAVEDNERADKQ